jgi:hypothetical protein
MRSLLADPATRDPFYLKQNSYVFLGLLLIIPYINLLVDSSKEKPQKASVAAR